jgi:hypothetical protein
MIADKDGSMKMPYLEFQSVPGAPVCARAAVGFVALVQKLRWMGLDEEAEELFAHFHDDWPSEAVVSIVPDTD